ncbi:hypothetical protein CXB51_025119 [Gossypium anomalum]|uniref:Uncharacterized protein n=1 Tax=Gossypium anomalum TaxID=47600 RepID=A0A8J5Y9Y9_9ROSI|nr:hypothetical protein CXB51_025119 [Gossypium anomalum]
MVALLSTLKIFYVFHLNLQPFPEEIPIDSKATIKEKAKSLKEEHICCKYTTCGSVGINTTNHVEQYMKKPIAMVAKCKFTWRMNLIWLLQ